MLRYRDLLRVENLFRRAKAVMDGRGRCMDNIFIERLWRSLKYEDIYLRAYATGSEVRVGIGRSTSLDRMG